MSAAELRDRIQKLTSTSLPFAEELERALGYVDSDAGSSLTKSRLVLEKVLLDVFRAEQKREPRKPLLAEMLADNQFTRGLDQRIVRRMHHIRDLANLGPHGEAVEPQDAERVLDDLCEVLDWYLDRYAARKPPPLPDAVASTTSRRRARRSRRVRVIVVVALLLAGAAVWILWPRGPRGAMDHLSRGNVLYDQGKFADAGNEYQAALKVEPDNELARIQLNNVLLKLGNVSGAHAGFEAFPNNPDLRRQLAQFARDQPAAKKSVAALAALAPPEAASTYLTQAFDRVTSHKKAAGYDYHQGWGILGGCLKHGGTLSFDIALQAGKDYRIIAAGDDDAIALVLGLFDKNKEHVAKDTSPPPEAFVDFTPAADDTYTLVVKLLDSKQKNPCAFLVTVLCKDGTSIPKRNWDAAFGRLVATLSAANQDLKRDTGRRLDLPWTRNQWMLFGTALTNKTSKTVRVELGESSWGMLGVADQQNADVDLFLLDANQEVLKKDDRIDPVAYIWHKAGPGTHSLRIQSFQPAGASVVMMGMFELR